jgi:hypothetical protein
MNEKQAPSIKQWVIFIVGSVFIYFYACGGEKDKESHGYTASPESPSPAADTPAGEKNASSAKVDLGIGKDYPVVEDVTVAKSEADFDELEEFVTAQDFEGWQLLRNEKIASGSAFGIVKGTKVRVINISWFTAKIRVLEGAYANQVGYIDHQFIRGFKE